MPLAPSASASFTLTQRAMDNFTKFLVPGEGFSRPLLLPASISSLDRIDTFIPFPRWSSALGIFFLFLAYIGYVMCKRYDYLPNFMLPIAAKLPTPGYGDSVTGHWRHQMNFEPKDHMPKWHAQYGDAFIIRGTLGDRRLVISDPKAIQHLMTKAYSFPKAAILLNRLTSILGNGLICAEGEAHRRQRRVLGPAFSPSVIAGFSPIFTTLGTRVAAKWDALINDHVDEKSCRHSEDESALKKGAIVNVFDWFNRLALDAVGLTAFGVDWESIDNDPHAALHKADHAAEHSHDSFESEPASGAVSTFEGVSSDEEDEDDMPSRKAKKPAGSDLGALFAQAHHADQLADIGASFFFRAILHKLIPRSWVLKKQSGQEGLQNKRREMIEKSAMAVYEERKAQLSTATEEQKMSKNLFNQLLKANASAEGKNVLSDDEVLGQMTTFIFAGHETSSTSLSWTLQLLAQKPEFQHLLRAELRAAKVAARDAGEATPEGELSYNDLEKLPMLDAVIKESLRIRPPVIITVREATEATVLPLTKPIQLVDGTWIDSLPIEKGQQLVMSTLISNQREDWWGEDGKEFRPSRWIEDPQSGRSDLKSGSAFANQMTFVGGTRACIGWRLAVSQMKAVLSIIVDKYHFEEMKTVEIEGRSFVVVRPRVKGQKDMGNQMPLRVSRAD